MATASADGAGRARPVVLMAHDYPPLTGGGLALAVGELARLLRADFDFRVLSSRLVDHFADDRGRLAALAQRDGVVYARASARRTLRWIRKADLVVVHWTFSFRLLSTLLLVAAPLLRRPTVCVIHTAPDHCDYNRLRRLPPRARRLLFWLVRSASRRCTAVVALSRPHAASLAAVGIPIACVLPLPVTPDGYASAGARRLRSRRPLQTVGIVGELSELKGADAIPALLPVLTPRFAVRIAGRGSFGPALSHVVATLPPEQRAGVVISDRVDPATMPTLYDEVDCLLVLSRSESQSRVTLEAMLSGVVVLARGAGGIVDLITDGATGYLVDPENPESVRGILLRLTADPAEAERVRRRALERATRAFADSRREWRDFLLGLVAGRARVPD